MLTLSQKIKFVEKVFGRAYFTANQKNMEVYCVVCAHKNKTKKKLSIRVVDFFCHCWLCGYNARSLLFLLKKYSTQENLDEYLNVFQPTLKNKAKSAIIDVVTEEKFSLPNDFKLLALETESPDPDIRSTLSYLTSRGISDRDLWYYKFGVSNQIKWYRRALMPSFDATGNANYLLGRSIDPKRMPKYQTPTNIQRESIIFNEINIDWSKQLVLCEGILDLVKCGENAVPLLGSSLNEQSLLFERIVVNNTPIVLALDNDMIDTAIPRISKKLSEYTIQAKVIDFNSFNKKDPGDMSKDEFQEALGTAKSLDWLNYIQSKLNRMTNVSLFK